MSLPFQILYNWENTEFCVLDLALELYVILE